MGVPFWHKDSLITHILFELGLFWYSAKSKYVLMRHPLDSWFSYQNFLTSKNDIFAHLLTSFSDQKSRWPTEFLQNGSKILSEKQLTAVMEIWHIYFFICHKLHVHFQNSCYISNNRQLKQINITIGTENSTFVVRLVNWWWWLCHILEYHRYKKEWRIANIHALTKLL
jgi:hypothetical protein